MTQICGSHVISIKSGAQSEEIGWSSELDHVPLIQRRKMLLEKKKSVTSEKQIKAMPRAVAVVKHEEEHCNLLDLCMMGDCNSQGTNVETYTGMDHATYLEVNIKNIGIEKVDTGVSVLAHNPMTFEIPAEIKVEHLDNLNSSSGDSVSGSPCAPAQADQLKSYNSSNLTDYVDHIVLQQRLVMLNPRRMLGLSQPFQEEVPVELNSSDGLDVMPASTDGVSCPTLLNTVRVKPEPLDNDELDKSHSNAAHGFPFNVVQVKSEQEIPNTLYEDEIDRMQLRDRCKVRLTAEDSELNISGNPDCLRKVVPTAINYEPTVSESSTSIRVHRPRKRKKTATDSVETALEEDAPGLLQVLTEQGVSVDEIKLYGEPESNDLIDESFIEEGFAELESVISKLFFQRNPLLKLAPVRCTKASKPSYCLACLFSLVEQTRYLRFRSWPAEWGWCRDLQSFIFVFERHNRIVLERPEYGYATYFFELVDSLPKNWQLKRLVTAMKLTSCGRVTLIENKALMVGEDLTEGEAQVLIQYGWTPNTGLGTMLNYRDRVVHDGKNEKDGKDSSSEWRSKIGKLLMDGYNGGSIVSTSINIDTKVTEHSNGENSQIKTEL